MDSDWTRPPELIQHDIKKILTVHVATYIRSDTIGAQTLIFSKVPGRSRILGAASLDSR